MELDKQLQEVAKRYMDEGYLVITHPDVNHLPDFAADFGVEFLATRGSEHVLIQVKHDRSALEADPNVPLRAGITNAQPGWRYDVIVLHPDDPARRMLRQSAEPSPEQIEEMLAEAERVAHFGTPRSAFVLAWAGLEAAMRRLAQRTGLNGKNGSTPLLLVRELYSAGYLSPDDFRRLEQARLIRGEIVHGLAPPSVDPAMVQHLSGLAKQLLAGSANAREVAV